MIWKNLDLLQALNAFIGTLINLLLLIAIIYRFLSNLLTKKELLTRGRIALQRGVFNDEAKYNIVTLVIISITCDFIHNFCFLIKQDSLGANFFSYRNKNVYTCKFYYFILSTVIGFSNYAKYLIILIRFKHAIPSGSTMHNMIITISSEAKIRPILVALLMILMVCNTPFNLLSKLYKYYSNRQLIYVCHHSNYLQNIQSFVDIFLSNLIPFLFTITIYILAINETIMLHIYYIKLDKAHLKNLMPTFFERDINFGHRIRSSIDCSIKPNHLLSWFINSKNILLRSFESYSLFKLIHISTNFIYITSIILMLFQPNVLIYHHIVFITTFISHILNILLFREAFL
ncbi:unnamed protein product [Gordionus sp. m RMFG-2023]